MLQRVLLDADSTEVRLRTPVAHVPTVVAGVASLFLGVAILIASKGLVGMVFGLVAIGLGIRMASAAARARVILTGSVVRETGDLLPHTYRAEDVAEFYVDRAPHLVPWTTIWIRFNTGGSRSLQQVRVLEFRGEVLFGELGHAASVMNQWLQGRAG